MAGSRELVAQGFLEKESKWLCRWNKRWVKLYDDGKLQTYTKEPNEVPVVASGSFLSTSFSDEAARMTLEVDILGAGILGHNSSCLAFTAWARPKYRLEILTQTERVHLGTNDVQLCQLWFSKLSAVALAVSRSVSPITSPANSPANSPDPLSPVVKPYMEPVETPPPMAQVEESPKSSMDGLDEESTMMTPMTSDGLESQTDPEPEVAETPEVPETPETLETLETPETPEREESGPKGKGKTKGKVGPPPLKGKGKGAATTGSAEATPPSPVKGTKGKGKGPPPPPRAPPKGKGKEAPVGKRPSFRVSLSGLKHHVAAFHDLSFADVKLKEEEWTQLHSLFHKEEVKKGRGKPIGERVVFSAQDFQAWGIFMKKKEMQMDLQPFQLERALRTLTPSMGQLSPEDLEMMLNHTEALKLLSESEHKDKPDLRELESKLLRVAVVPRLPARLRVMLTMGTWRDTAALVSQNATYIRKACEEFRKSDALRHLMALTAIIYNRVMWGEELDDSNASNGMAKCFDIKSLSQLKATKATQGRDTAHPPMSMLHFIMGLMRKQCPERTLSQVEAEFKHVELAKNVDVGELTTILQKLHSAVNMIQNEMENHHEDYVHVFPPLAASAAARAQNAAAASPASPASPASDLDSESSDETCSPERRPSGGMPKSCLGKMMLLKQQLEEQLEKSRQEILEAETDGIELLKYFGHQARTSKGSSSSSSPASPSSKDEPAPGDVKNFFKNFSEFLRKDFRTSWQDLDGKFKNALGSHRIPRTPRTPRTPGGS